MTGNMFNHRLTPARMTRWLVLSLAVLLLATTSWAVHGNGAIEGLTGPSFELTARDGYIRTGDGGEIYVWGYADGGGLMQYPGPTLIVNEGDSVTITLTSRLPQASSIVIAGFEVTASGGNPGILTREAPPDQITAVTYTFTADRPGTFLYSSGTNADFQVEMGLVGALIVRPTALGNAIPFNNADPATWTGYGDARSQYDHEYLFLMTEMDPRIHELAEAGRFEEISTHDYFPVYWFLNGRTGPDTMLPPHVPWLPHQPYNCFPMMNVRDRMLMRVMSAGRDAHPYHTHGNNFDLVARDGWQLESLPDDPTAARQAEIGTIPDLSVSNFTLNAVPGATYDTIFTWTGRGLGWDMYGHTADAPNDGICDTVPESTVSTVATDPATGLIYDVNTREYCEDHGKPFPVVLPSQNDLAFGAFYSGSPFLGAAGTLPPGEGGNNPNAGYAFMWHSHNEKELTNNDIFPGGLLTMMIVDSPTAGE